MALERKALNQIRIASPCTVEWSTMKGDDQVRHCGECNMNVYNLSAMSLDEISHLLEKKEGRTCVRFYRRHDGTVITDDCPTGLKAVRRRMAMMATAFASILAATGLGMFTNRGAMARTLRDSKLGQFEVVRQLADWMTPEPIHRTTMGECMPIQGRMIAVPPAVQQQTEQRQLKMGKLAR